jgi:hypothetical protein
LRATVPAEPGCFSPQYDDALYMIRDSVRRRNLLIYGKLADARGEHCAIGAYFADNPKSALSYRIIDEVAAYNDSIPPATSEKTRRRKVLAWLNFKLQVLTGRARP